MADRQFPKNPLRGHRDAFENSDGDNPFAEEGQAEASSLPEADQNIFTPPVTTDAGAYEVEYATVFTHRKWTVLGTGVISLVGSVLLIVLSLFWPYGVVLVMCSLPVSIAGCAMGYSDLTAMTKGAMEREGRRLTAIGFWLSVQATVAAGGFLVKSVIDTFVWLTQG